MDSTVRCTQCHNPLPGSFPGAAGFAPCPVCAADLKVVTFPALHRVSEVAANLPANVAGGASCFFHPQSAAVVPCDVCGRFLCALCDIDFQGQHLCPGCLSVARRKKAVHDFESHRLLYGNLALLIALLPIVIWPLTLVTAPMAVFIAIYGWNKPGSVTRAGKFRHVLAAGIGLAEMFGWFIFIYSLFIANT